jgi:hypothetical protein
MKTHLKSLLAAIALLTATSGASTFYQPAEYRWYVESLDLAASLRPSQPICRVLAKGTTFPVVLEPATISSQLDAQSSARCAMVVRQGLTGAIVSSVQFKANETWTLPYLPAEFYSVFIKCFSADGGIAFSATCCLNILEDNTPPAGRVAPPLDKTIFSVSVADGQLFVKGLPQGGTSLHVIARNPSGQKLFEQLFPVADGQTNGTFALTDLAPGQFLNLSIGLKSAVSILDQANLFYFKRGTFPASSPDWAAVPPPAHKLGPFIIHENQALKGGFENNQPGLNALVEGMKKRGTDLINLNFKWNHIEPVTGVYNWSEVDQYVQYFTDRRIPFGLIIGGAIFNSAPYDTWGEWMMDSTGECQLWRKLCITSPASGKFRQAIKSFVRAVHARYGGNPYFASWTFSGQGLDSGIFMDHFNRVTDYSPWARSELVDYLTQRYRTLDRLNSAWNTTFASWSAVMPPLPDWNSEVDISQPWIDFNACKLKIYADSNTKLYDPVVRQLDKTRKLSHYLTYTGPIEYLFSDMLANKSHLNDGGGEAHQMVRLYSVGANWGIRRQPESHDVPPANRLQLQDMITNTLRYGLQNSDLGMVWNSTVNIHATHYPKNTKLQDSMVFWTQIAPLLRTITQSSPLPPPVGFILSWDDLFCRTRAWRWYALPGEQLQKAAANASLGNVPWLSGITPERVYDQLDMLVCDADCQVFSPELLDKLERFVKRGGSLVICGTAGQYTVGSKETYAWRKRLKAPKALNPDGLSEWRLGQGQIIYSPESAASQLKGQFLVEMMHRCGVARNVVSSNPGVQGFLLNEHNEHNDKLLVISAFKGFDSLRKLKDKSALPAVISLPTISEGAWSLTRLYPETATEATSAKALQNPGISVSLPPSGLALYRLKKQDQK